MLCPTEAFRSLFFEVYRLSWLANDSTTTTTTPHPALGRKSFSVFFSQIILKHLEIQWLFHLIQQATGEANIPFLNMNEKFIIKSMRVMLAYQTPESGSYVLLQLMKYTLKSRHLITLKACRAKWKITVWKAEMLINLYNVVNGNTPVVMQRLSVCYFSFCEIDSLNFLSAEMGLFAFSNHWRKSNKLLQLRSLHTIGRAHVFLPNSSIKTTSMLPSHLTLTSRHLYRCYFWRGNPSVSLHDGKFLNVWTARNFLDGHQPHTKLLLHLKGWLSST